MGMLTIWASTFMMFIAGSVLSWRPWRPREAGKPWRFEASSGLDPQRLGQPVGHGGAVLDRVVVATVHAVLVQQQGGAGRQLLGDALGLVPGDDGVALAVHHQHGAADVAQYPLQVREGQRPAGLLLGGRPDGLAKSLAREGRD